MAVQFEQKTIDEFEGIAKRYPVRRAANGLDRVAGTGCGCVADAGDGSRLFLHHVPKEQAGQISFTGLSDDRLFVGGFGRNKKDY